jgi:hypothetical protein
MTNDTNNTGRGGTEDSLERGLEAMTRWEGGEVGAWRAAAVSAGVVGRGMGGEHVDLPSAMPRVSIWQRPIPQSWLGIAAVVVLAGVVISVIMPAVGTARSSARRVSSPVPAAGLAVEPADVSELRRSAKGTASGDATDDEKGVAAGAGSSALVHVGGSSQASSAADRHVIRKATMELKSVDVRATFAKVGLLVSEAEGEYVEASTLSGEGASSMGQLTLRVSAARLSRVLNELRGLGKVTSESAGGEDVTDKVVDLEARIRNEQRVEGELLELLKKQSDAKLKDVLELRGEINRVRERIEQLHGQREKLGRLTALATVLVLVRAEDAPPVVKQGALGELFAKAVGDSWKRGVETLIGTVAFLVRLIVGGLVWWMVLVGTVTAAVVLRRREVRRRASEPAPVV